MLMMLLIFVISYLLTRAVARILPTGGIFTGLSVLTGIVSPWPVAIGIALVADRISVGIGSGELVTVGAIYAALGSIVMGAAALGWRRETASI